MMRRALLISPHFPPDSTAGTHRVRILAPHLSAHGWEPTVLTCETAAYEGVIDPDLAAMVPASLRVIRAPAWSASMTRLLGVGDLGLRSFAGLRRAAVQLLENERFDVLFVTIFPAYTALLGAALADRFNIPFVLDYQDPWVNAWGDTVGGGPGGRVDMKSQASRWLAGKLEPRAVRSASAITAVSRGTYEPVLERNPGIHPVTAVIPIGGESRDFAGNATGSTFFDADDGHVHVCYVGTILPLGLETLSAVLEATALVRERRPELYKRLRLHFFGTSNRSVSTDELRVLPEARRLGVADVVTEVPTRIPYSQAVAVQRQASVLLAMGSSEPHYTASKIFPLLLARRPLLAVYHERSTVVDIVSKAVRQPSVRLITYSDASRAREKCEAICDALVGFIERPVWNEADVRPAALGDFLAETLAGKLASVFDEVARQRAAA